MSIKVDGVWRDSKSWWTKVNGTWREGIAVWTKVGGEWKEKQFSSPMVISINDSDMYLSAGSTTTSTIYTSYRTCSVVGGVAPYSFWWERVSGSSSVVSEDSDDDYNRFKRTEYGSGTAYFRCRVTDANGQIEYSGNLQVYMYKTEPSTAVTASLSASVKSAFSTDGSTARTGDVTCYSGGGTGGYTYKWEKVSGSSNIAMSSTINQTIQFKCSAIGDYATYFRCKVKDSSGAYAYSGNILVNCQVSNGIPL